MSIESLLHKYDENIRALALESRKLILDHVKDMQETVDLPANMLAYGLGPGYKGMVCTLIFSKKGIKMGFYKGTELDDPAGLLEGSGKAHRYVQLSALADVYRPALKDLLKQAVLACRKRLAE